SIDYKRK
ncbi:membrane protein, partial [Salmonella enterica subsp. enterica serovar Typhimurium]